MDRFAAELTCASLFFPVTVYLHFCGTANSHGVFGWHLVLLDKNVKVNMIIYINT